jgi:hypothetical protein
VDDHMAGKCCMLWMGYDHDFCELLFKFFVYEKPSRE